MRTAQKQWYTPAGSAPNICLDMLRQPHLLIAGSTGSGKSVLLNSLIYTALYRAPHRARLVLIDPKRVELVEYAELPHTLRYASEPREIPAALTWTVSLMEQRYTRMQAERVRESADADVYVIIDEYADLMTTQRRETLPLLQRLAQLGRAAHVHLIAATQRPTKDIVNGQVKVNMDARLALRCPTAQDSRNIINVKGAETLPRYGKGLYLTPETMQPVLVDIPMTAQGDITARVRWWTQQTRPLSLRASKKKCIIPTPPKNKKQKRKGERTMTIYIITDTRYNALRAISDTERGESGYSLRAEAVNATAEQLVDSGAESDTLSCICDDSRVDCAAEYINPTDDTLYSELCGVYLMTREAYEYWTDALAAIERGENPFD